MERMQTHVDTSWVRECEASHSLAADTQTVSIVTSSCSSFSPDLDAALGTWGSALASTPSSFEMVPSLDRAASRLVLLGGLPSLLAALWPSRGRCRCLSCDVAHLSRSKVPLWRPGGSLCGVGRGGPALGPLSCGRLWLLSSPRLGALPLTPPAFRPSWG